MKIIFQILWVLTLCFSASQSQERNNGFNQRRQLRSSGQVLTRSRSAQVKRFPNPNPPRSILPQYHQNLAAQSLSRSTNSKLLPPKKQLLLKSSIPKNQAKPQTHSNKVSQGKLGPAEHNSKTQSRPSQPQAYQNNPIQKGPHFKSPIHNRPNSLPPGPLSYSKRQPQKTQSLPNSSVRKVIRPFKSPSNTIFQPKPQLNKRNPNPRTLQKASPNKAYANEFATRRTRERKPYPKALVQNVPCHTKIHLQPPGRRKYIQLRDPRKCPQPLSQGRRHLHPLGQKIPNPPIKVPGKIQVPATIPPTAATTSNAPSTEISTPLVTTTPLTAIMETTPFTTQEITTVHATAGDPTIISNTTTTFTAATLITTTSSATTVQNATASTTTSSAADTEGIKGLRMTTESGYETTELPYSSTNPDDNYIFETTDSYYYYD